MFVSNEPVLFAKKQKKKTQLGLPSLNKVVVFYADKTVNDEGAVMSQFGEAAVFSAQVKEVGAFVQEESTSFLRQRLRQHRHLSRKGRGTTGKVGIFSVELKGKFRFYEGDCTSFSSLVLSEGGGEN